MKKKYKILIVDDERTNIEILKNALLENYEIYATIDGAKALAIIPKIEPDLILLDVVMPQMDGYTTLANLKKMPKYNDIPVMFLTAKQDIESKEKGFSLGAVDYITKPFEIAEIKMRLKTQLNLKASEKEIKLLLSKTLSGSIQMLLEIFSMTNPTIFSLSLEIKNIVKTIIKEMNLENAWKYELSAMLAHIGCFVIVDEDLLKIIKGEEVSPEIQSLYDKHPELGSNLVKKIPRLDFISDVILDQNKLYGYRNSNDEKILCSQILEVAKFYVISQYRKKTLKDILTELRMNRNRFSPPIVEILEHNISKIEDSKLAEEKIQEITLEKIEEGFVLEENIYSVSNEIIAKKGVKVNNFLIEHLRLMRELGKVNGATKISVKF